MMKKTVEKYADLDPLELLRFEPEKGRIKLDDYRMVLLSACAVGALRKELVETLGWERARGLLKRFGYAAGLADAVALEERFPLGAGGRQLDIGPLLHALEGIAKVVRGEESPGETICGHYWEHSFEAEQHRDLFGGAEEPVCWILTGYAAGHASAASGTQVVVVEEECLAMGHERCRFVVARAEDEPDLYQREAKDYTPQHLPEVLQKLQETIEAKNKAISQLSSEVERARRGRFVGESAPLMQTLDTAQAVAPYSSTVLIQGESGTGKELLARFVHEQSKQADQPFVAVNCSALPESLQEAELFGYARGAFTGATSPQAGVFEAAHGGTLFLDEIGDLSLSAQTKILRALQEGEIKRLGETRTRLARPRIITATHRHLETMVSDGHFREDLFYRLSVVVVTLPPLRGRGNDVIHLANHFLGIYSERFGKKVRALSHDAAFALLEHNWPGNVRELENVIQRAVILASSERIEVEDFPESLRHSPFAPPGERRNRRAEHAPGLDGASLGAIDDEKSRIEKALALTDGNREHAATLLGISRTTLWRRMKALEVDEL